MKEKIGKIVVEGGANVWPHEYHTAKALTLAAHEVRFVPTKKYMCTADAFVDGVIFEFKAPEGSSIKSVERNLVKALHNQSPNVVIDSFRMKNVRDKSILNFLKTKLKEKRGLKRVYFVDRKGNVFDINEMI